MQTKCNLPFVCIIKLLIMEPLHPIVKILEQEFYNYKNYVDDDYKISFYEYITNFKDFYIKFIISKK